MVREEVTAIDDQGAITIVATGPLTSDALTCEILRLSGSEQLYFYDSISPIVEADSIDMSRVYMAARYDKGTADYINCPMSKEEYDRFLDALLEAHSVDAKDWEKLNYFESCLPIEEIARRGRDTLRFGPMKPVGLRDPRTGHMPYAVVQLRQENLRADSYNLVGFQNHLKFGEQARILRLIPGLENAKFLRYGQIHRNTYINSPTLLRETLQMKQHPNVLFAGQISGVEGYVESIATGLLAGMQASALALNAEPVPPPRATAFGALVNYICHAEAKHFQPANITFDLLMPLDEATRRRVRDKKQRHAMVCERALAELQAMAGRATGMVGKKRVGRRACHRKTHCCWQASSRMSSTAKNGSDDPPRLAASSALFSVGVASLLWSLTSLPRECHGLLQGNLGFLLSARLLKGLSEQSVTALRGLKLDGL